MNRELKFRAWTANHWINKGMVYDWQNTTYVESVGFQPWDDEDDIPIMQYIGIKDKNGKEMWEGDIVRITNQPDFPNATVNHGRIGVIIYSDDTPEFVIKGNFLFQHIQLFDGVEFEVIGNVYENRELVSGE